MQITSAKNVLLLTLNQNDSEFVVSCTQCDWSIKVSQLCEIPEACPCCSHHVLHIDTHSSNQHISMEMAISA
ncbi:MAG: hypothetical protein CMI09_15235 [Oceanospirillaceae bacterium]|nr:hypothetical protein [Oceanospirillaceae bacterium]